ncbi:MAG: peptide deformylase [Litoreibacter sp.]
MSILRWPDKRLRTAASPVEEITEADRTAWDLMIKEMEAMPGVGLASVQVGYMRSLAVVDASAERGQVIRMANPRVLHESAKMNEHEEASPCLPGVFAKVSRPRAVTVEFMDETGERREKDFVGLWATSVQHQIDHLAGKMYFDHLSRTKRAMLIKRAGKIA